MVQTSRRPATERRLQIAAALLRIVGERGLPAVSTAALAAEVGLSSGALFRHFPTLEAIWPEAVRLTVDELEATFPDPKLPPLERLLALMRNRVDLLSHQLGMAWLLRSEQAELVLPPEALSLLAGLIARSRSFLLTALQEGRADGSIRADVPLETLLVTVKGTIQMLVGGPSLHAHALRQRPDVDLVLGGVARLFGPCPVAAVTGFDQASDR
jgi:AcrR family transcriptional regulator